jgi:hypothetical protein
VDKFRKEQTKLTSRLWGRLASSQEFQAVAEMEAGGIGIYRPLFSSEQQQPCPRQVGART